MPRAAHRSSRSPAETPREAALRATVKRLRSELAEARRGLEAAGQGPKSGAELDDAEFADLMRKLGRLYCNVAYHFCSEDERCGHCGGLTRERVEMMFIREAEAVEAHIAEPGELPPVWVRQPFTPTPPVPPPSSAPHPPVPPRPSRSA